MTPPDAELAATGSTAGVLAALRRPAIQVWLMAFAVLVVGAAVGLIEHDRSSDAIENGSWWAFVVVTLMFVFTEISVFEVHARNEGHSFGMGEVPIAFALVFLSPFAAIAARVLASGAVIVGPRKNRGYKLAFNIASFVFHTALAVMIFRRLYEWWGATDTALVLAVVVALMATELLASALISVAIARSDGNTWQRVVDELSATWWLVAVNSIVSAMCISLALFRPSLALLALPAVLGMWHVLRTYGNIVQELRELDALHGFTGRVGRTLDVDEIADAAVADLTVYLRADGAALVRFTDDGAVLHSAGALPLTLPERADDPRWRDLIESGSVHLVTPDVLRSRGISSDRSRSAMVTTISDDEGPFALLVLAEKPLQKTRFDDATVGRLENLSQQLAVSLRRGMLHERLEYEARHDALTDLPSRTLFERFVTEAVRDPGDGVWAVVMLDLDRFKEVNDTLGHHAGDDLLIEFSRRMAALLGPSDHLARLAGDEFAILCHRSSQLEIEALAAACVREGGAPVLLDGLEIVVTVSVGVAGISPLDDDALQPMRRADIAMYNAKWQRTGVELYRDEIDRRTPARLSMLGDLRAAIADGELDVVFQPKLSLSTGRVVGAEALVRWEHPARGVVQPSEFVRVAEDTGLIKDLTDLVLARSIATLREFEAADLGLGLAVNLSTHDLFDARLPERVAGYLAENKVAPRSLTLEITESSLLVDAPRTRATIDDLHAVGLRLAVDDFGTGYSSLSYLRRLPVHELKIDHSFVSGMLHDEQDEVIVRSTVDLGHNLGLLVVAEGVEDRAILERLGEVGCDVAQGYAISQPISGDEFIPWVRRIHASTGPPLSWVAS